MNDEPPLRIWSNFPWPEAVALILRDGAGRHQLTINPKAYANYAPNLEHSDPAAAQAHVLLGQPDPALVLAAAAAADSPLRWVHVTSAGITRYDTAEVRRALRERGIILTNSSSVFDEPCAQHLAAMVLALARQLPQALDNQRGARSWVHPSQRSERMHLLNGQTAIIYGYGAIARRTVELLRPFGLRLFGVRRAARGDEGIPLLTQQEADARLGEADHVLNILPDNESTQRFFDAECFARCKRGARFYNIGRGATVDQDALLGALRAGQLESAYLDVMDPEPLPPEHPLWREPGCYVTAHVAGAHFGEDERLARHFLANLAAFGSGQLMRDRIV